MGLADLFKKKTTTTLPEEVLIKHGKTGTEILSGMIQEEYNNDLQFPDSVKIYDEMRRSDATVAAVLKALKNPLLSAEWDIQAGGETDKDKEIAAFVDKNIFENINFQDWLRQTLSYLDFGFMYFEKVFQVKDGMIEWKEFAPRLPKAHYKWSIDGEEWRDGHPAGITQQINSDDEGKNTNYPTIPWEKLILFTNDREGNNYEGVSILRAAYKHYFYKDLGYKIQSVAAERFGVGMPVATVKNSMGKPNRLKVEEFLKNIRSNEKSYGLLTDEVSKFEIMTPNGTGVGAQIEKMIEHHDKKLYDLILAGFLNLTSGDGGSNALSKDQSSFFLRGLQSVADYIISVMNEQIKELVDMNYSGIEAYPTLFVSEIGVTSMAENITAIGTAVDKGLIDITVEDKMAFRQILKLPTLSKDDIIAAAEEAQAAKDKAAETALKQAQASKAPPEEKPAKPEKKLAEEDKKKVPTPREVAFTKNITAFEKYLETKYSEAETIVANAEKEYQDALIELYDNSDSERVDGVVCLVFDKTKITAGKNKIAAITAKLEKKLLGSELQDEIFTAAIDRAKSTLDDNDKKLSWSLDIPQGQINTFIEGYKSNMQGVIFNESRRVLENITLNYGSEASVEAAKETAKAISFNKNILSLSFVTHPRALYKFIIYDESIGEGFTLFKPIVPNNRKSDLAARPFGITAGIAYTILTAAQINAYAAKTTDGKTADALTGLGLHHGSFEYYYPIASVDIDSEKEIAKIQRDEILNTNS